jgi:hypothetical protein
MAREAKTVGAMIRLHCHDNHGVETGLCAECDELLEYARERLERCPFQEGKTTCARCPVHCFKPAMRERIRGVMRYAGPRMIYRHPTMALFHLVDGLRKEPIRREQGR